MKGNWKIIKVSFICIGVGQLILPKDQNKSLETKLCRVSCPRVEFLVQQHYVLMDTFCSPIL